MIEINGIEYLNYEEQVMKNKRDIENIQEDMSVILKDVYMSSSATISGKTFTKLLPIGYRCRNYECNLKVTTSGTLVLRSGTSTIVGSITLDPTKIYTLYVKDNDPADYMEVKIVDEEGTRVLDYSGVHLYFNSTSSLLGYQVMLGNIIVWR